MGRSEVPALDDQRAFASVTRNGRIHAKAELTHAYTVGCRGECGRATRVAYGVGGGRDVQVGAQGAVVRAVLQVRGTYSARRSREAAMSCSVSSGRSRCFANAGTAPVSNTSTFSAGSDEFPQLVESLCI
jgi:hypothetical protein